MTTMMTSAFHALAPKILAIVGLLFVQLGTATAQSGSQNFPTPITSNEINGTIRARDLGDARLTTYYYAFIGNQGDIFLNVVTKNFDGDIDVFTADTLKPLTKIVVYSDSSDNETGRVVYMRQTQKLLLRIEGRTPNDEPATFRIKFAGSFAPSTEVASADPKLSDRPANEDAEARVNSVGTIIAARPKPTPKPVEREVEPVTVEKKTVDVPVESKVEPVTTEPSKTPEPKTDTEAEAETPKPEVIVTDELPKPKAAETETPVKPTAPTTKPRPQTRRRARAAAKPDPTPKPEPPKPDPNPLENIRLIVLFKDGTKIERPMSEVLKVSVDKGMLTIIHKDGSIGRYSILDVAKMTIEWLRPRTLEVDIRPNVFRRRFKRVSPVTIQNYCVEFNSRPQCSVDPPRCTECMSN